MHEKKIMQSKTFWTLFFFYAGIIGEREKFSRRRREQLKTKIDSWWSTESQVVPLQPTPPGAATLMIMMMKT